MINVFDKNPVSVYVLDVKSFDRSHSFRKIVKQRIIWANTKDKKILSSWEKEDYKELKKTYTNIKTGGNEEQEDIIFDDNDMEMLADNTVTIAPVDIEEIKEYVVVSDIFMFPEDKITDFKNKIFIATKIPTYRQHIFYEHGKNIHNVGYQIIDRSGIPSIKNINIQSINQHTVFHENLPVDNKWYQKKNSLNVINNNDTVLMGNLYEKHSVTEFYVVDLNDFLDPIRVNIGNLFKTDKYSLELIYCSFVMKYWPHIQLSVLGDIIINENSLCVKHPDLAPDHSMIKARYIEETKILSNYSPEIDSKKWDVPIVMGIKNASVVLLDIFVLAGYSANIRNIFDLFELSPTVNYIVCMTEIEGRTVILSKGYKDTVVPRLKLNINTITVNIQESVGSMHFILYSSGAYKIDIWLNEHVHYNFLLIRDFLFNKINPVIEQINTFGNYAHTGKLPILSENNYNFSDISAYILWKMNLSSNKFQEVKKILDKYVTAGIFKKNTNEVIPNRLDYYFIKGMNKYLTKYYLLSQDNMNQYSYLTNINTKKIYETLINKKKISITHRFTDIRIDVSGIKDREYIIFYLYVLRLCESFPREKETITTSDAKKLKMLKERDPNLFDMKAVYGSDLVYAKICQQQKQPVIYDTPGKNRVQYWNMTTNTPNYYECPNPMYPYLNFITGIHPKKYCLPCCYKMPVADDPNNKKTIKYKKCIEEKEYDIIKKTVSRSRYIIAYGKPIDVGRISRLPENSLEPLFYDTFSENKYGTDEECYQNEGYYIFGVSQNFNNVTNIGYIFSISNALNKNIIDFVIKTIEKIKENSLKWIRILNGDIIKYFTDSNEFISELNSVFIDNKLSSLKIWNDIFIDIVSIYWNIETLKCIDIIEGDELSDVHVTTRNISRLSENMIHNSYIVVIYKNKSVYPIYSLHHDIYFRNGDVKKKIFVHSDLIVEKLHNVISRVLGTINKKRRDVDSFIIRQFIEQEDLYSINSLYIDSSNTCYGIGISVANTKFFIPIVYSDYDINIGYELLYDYPVDMMPSWAIIEKFIELFNTFIKTNEEDYTEITVETWLLLENTDTKEKITGFVSNGINYLIQPITEKKAISMHNVPCIKLLYNPIVINTSLIANNAAEVDYRSKNIDKCLYDRHLYTLLIIEFINYIGNQRNIELRNSILSHIDENKSLSELLKNYPGDYRKIDQIIMSIVKPQSKTTENEIYKENYFSIKDAKRIIDSSVFSFDNVQYIRMNNMNYDEVLNELKQIFDSITVDEEPQFRTEFPNILTPCSNDIHYCKGGKLMVKKKKLNKILEIMATDVLNPFKSKYIFNPVFTNNIINSFKLTMRKDENITINLL